MFFKSLKISSWQQFQDINIEFHKRITILTGANASGKTTILNLLAKHCGWNSIQLATPKKDKFSIWKWLTGPFREDENPSDVIGSITYSDDKVAKLEVPQKNTTAEYNISISDQQGINCFIIPSHRSVFRYVKVSQIPTSTTINKQQAFDKVSGSNRSRYFGGNDSPSSFHMKETLIAWNLFGRGNEDMEGNEMLLDYYQGFETVLTKVLPDSLGFEKFAVRNFEIVLLCKSGNFVIDGASGGISALIDMAWQIYMYSEKNPEFTVLIDEIENHLHPTMQRQVLPDLLEAFPNTRFIVTTHNPLVVGSVKDSNVYALKYNNDNKIVSQELDFINKAKTATEILDEVLGVSVTMPIWAEERLNEIITEFSSREMTEQEFNGIREKLGEMGLEKLLPEAVYKLIESKNEETK